MGQRTGAFGRLYLGRRREADASGPTPEEQEEMAGKPEAETERMVFDGLEIDVPGRTVVARGETCNLTAREFDLLVVLARRPRRVFTRDELMSLVWGYTDYVDPNAVRVVVCRIREKIEEDPAQPRLHRHGAGRRLSVSDVFGDFERRGDLDGGMCGTTGQ